MRLSRFVSLFLCLAVAVPSFAWWETGHRTVARIAAAYLKPKTRTRVAQILGVKDTPDSVANALAVASTWADDTKGQTKTGEWHYIDLALQDSKRDIKKRCPDQNCLPARIEIFQRQLARRTPSGVSDRDALRYLVHFVGDISQPLHSVSNADLGGNCEQIRPVNEARNLHSLWDGGIVNALHENDVRLADNLEGYVGRLSGGERKKWAKGDPDKWVWEAHTIAKQDIYGRLHIPLQPVVFPKTCSTAPGEIANFRPYIDGAYINDMKPIVRDQLAKAGLRLARILNDTLK